MRAVVIVLLVGAVSLSQTACRCMMGEAEAEELGLTADNPLSTWLAPEYDPVTDEDEPVEQTTVDNSYWFENTQSYYSTLYSAYYDQWYYTQYYGRWYCEICGTWHYQLPYDTGDYYHDPDEDGENDGE